MSEENTLVAAAMVCFCFFFGGIGWLIASGEAASDRLANSCIKARGTWVSVGNICIGESHNGSR